MLFNLWDPKPALFIQLNSYVTHVPSFIHTHTLSVNKREVIVHLHITVFDMFLFGVQFSLAQTRRLISSWCQPSSLEWWEASKAEIHFKHCWNLSFLLIEYNHFCPLTCFTSVIGLLFGKSSLFVVYRVGLNLFKSNMSDPCEEVNTGLQQWQDTARGNILKVVQTMRSLVSTEED